MQYLWHFVVNMHMQIKDLILEGYRDAVSQFRQEANDRIVKTYIDAYRDLVQRNQVSGQEKNIDYWRKQGWAKFRSFIDRVQAWPSKTQIKRAKLPDRVLELNVDPRWTVIMPLSSTASCHFGKGTKWCTSAVDDNRFDAYFYEQQLDLIYCIKNTSGIKWAILYDRDKNEFEFWNTINQQISQEDFTEQTGLNPNDIVVKIPRARLDQLRKSYDDFVKRVIGWAENPQSNTDIENEIIQRGDRAAAVVYVAKLGQHLNGKVKVPERLAMLAVTDNKEKTSFKKLMSDINYYYHPLEHIANPSQAVEQAALKTDPMAAAHIAGIPDDKLENLVRRQPKVIAYVKNPSEKLQLIAVTGNPDCVAYLPNASEKVRKTALMKNGRSIFWIANPTRRERAIAITNDASAIDLIKNPSLDEQLMAVKQNVRALAYIPNPSYAVMITAIEKTPSAIFYIKDPSPMLQQKAVEADPQVYSLLKNPAPSVTKYVSSLRQKITEKKQSSVGLYENIENSLYDYWDPIIVKTFGLNDYTKTKESLYGYKSSTLLNYATNSDPTKDKQYVNWIMTQFILRNKNIKLESVEQIHNLFQEITEVIRLYFRLKNKNLVPADYMDINKFKTVEDLKKALQKFMPVSRQLTSAEQEIIDQGTYVDDDSHPIYKVIQVGNKEAAEVLSHGTVWKDIYNDDLHLLDNDKEPIFIINKNNPADKFVVTFSSFIIYEEEEWRAHLYDKAGEELDLTKFLENNHLIKQGIIFDLYEEPNAAILNSLSKADKLWVIEKKPQWLEYFDDLDEELCSTALKHDLNTFFNKKVQEKLSTKLKTTLLNQDERLIDIFLSNLENVTRNIDIIPLATRINAELTMKNLNSAHNWITAHKLVDAYIAAFSASLCAAQFADKLPPQAQAFVVDKLGDVQNQLHVLSKCPALVKFIDQPDSRIVDFIFAYHKPQIHLLQHVPASKLRGDKAAVQQMTSSLLKKIDPNRP